MGIVQKSGPGTVGKFSEGQRVVAVPWGTKAGNGTWAQYTCVPETYLLAVPDALSTEHACQFLVNPLTAMGFFDTLHVPKGGWLLNNAAGSVLGRMVIKLAKEKGVKTVNIVRRAELVEELKQIGADEVILSSEEDVAARVKEVTDGKGAFAALEPVVGEDFVHIVGATADHGTVLVYGAMAGFTAHFNVSDVLFR